MQAYLLGIQNINFECQVSSVTSMKAQHDVEYSRF